MDSEGDEECSRSTLLRDDEGARRLELAALNHVALGEWEAARAHLTVLASSYPVERKRVKEILISLVLKAREYWTDSVSVPSPHHLCWLALQTFLEIFPESKKEIPASVQSVVQFCLLLNSCCHGPSYSEPTAEWLSSYQAMLVSDPSGSTFKPHLHLLPPNVISFLLQVLTKDPPLGHALISSLRASSTNQHYVSNNESLQLLYLDCIENSLRELNLPSRAAGSRGDDSQYESDTHQHSKPGDLEEDDEKMRLVERVYTMLSFLDPTPNLSKVMIRLAKILEVLLQASPADGGTLFTREEIYSCFLGRSSPLLIRRLQEMEGFQRNAGDSAIEDEDREGEAALKWKKVFFDALQKNQHFLENVMNRGIKLICSGQLEDLARLLSYSDLVPLRPLLLLLGWDKNPDVGSGKELLDTLWPRVGGETMVVQQLLYDGCSKLAFQVGLVQWCLDKARPFLPADSSPSSTSAGDVFQGLKSHSILYVLHHSTPLSSLDSSEVIEILKLRPDTASLSPKHLPTPSPFSPPASPSISSHSGTPMKRSSQPSGSALKPEQERDITIYRSFCCLKLVMEAVWTSILLNHGIVPSSSSTQASAQPKPPAKASRRLSYAAVSSPGPSVRDSNEEADKGPKPQSEQTYQQEVVGKLEQAKTHLSSIFPLNYRLEVLENIFSLLFLTGDDIKRSEEGISSSSSSSLTGVQSSARSSVGSESESLSGVHSLAFICKQQGFVVGETLAGDLLNLLQDCMFELAAAKYALLTRDAAIPPSSAICSSVSPGSLQQRITKLQKQINEAKWRLELVSSKHGISSESKDAGGEWSEDSSGEDSVSDTSDKEASGGESGLPKMKLHKSLDSSDNNRSRSRSRSRSGQTPSPSCIKQPRPMQVSPQPSQLAGRPPKRGSARERHHHGGGGAGSSTLSTDEAYERSGNCADIEERSPDRGPRKKRLRTRTSSVSLRQKGSTVSTHTPSIICQMLATPDNLLCKCLKHNNYQRAREVLKMFVMEGQLGEALVHFSEQFEIISRDLIVQSRSSTPRPSPSALTPVSEMSAASGSGAGVGGVMLQTAILSMSSDPAALESLHRLLAPAVTSRMLFASNPQLEQVAQDIPLLVTLQENVPALTMLDIVCSNRVEGATAKRVIQMAVTRSKTALDLLPANMESHHTARKGERRSSHDRKSTPADRNTLMGPLSLLHIFSEVSGYFILRSHTSTSTLTSPHSLLTQFPLPLAIDSVMNWKTFMDSYWEARDQVEAAVQQCPFKDVLELAAQPTAAPNLPSRPVLNDLVSALRLNPVISRRDGGGGGVHFLWHFGQYLTKLVGLLLKCVDNTEVEGTTHNQLLLSTLRHSPMKLIGRLVFEKSISPQRVEQFMADLPHLKIVEVIIKCCCPSITNSSLPSVSWRGPVVYALNQPSTDTFNGSSSTTAEDDDPCALSHKLLSKLLTTLKGLCQTEDGVITPHNLLAASQSTEMKKILSCTAQLSSVSLTSLQNKPEHQLAFYCNVVNLLYAHAIITFLQWEGQEEGWRLFGGTHISLGVLQSDTVVQSLLFSRVGYYIGELGLISCYDLHHNILRVGFSPPFLDKTSMLRSRPAIGPSDPWSAYVPSQPDPRVLFVISNGTLSSPLPRLLQPEHVNSELDTAETKYIRANVTFDLSKYEINIPKLLDTHRDDFIPNKSHYDPANPYRELSNIALARYIAHKQPTELAEKLSEMFDACDTNRFKKGHPTKLKMGVVEEDCNIGYAFPLKRRLSMLEGSTPPPHSPLLKKKPRNGRIYEKIKPYMFTSETMEFVSTQSKLLGSLVVLLCPPENAPSRQQLDLPAADGQVIPESDEVEREMKVWEKEKEVEMQRATAFMQTVGNHPPPSAAAVRPVLRRSHSLSEDGPVLNRPSNIWRETFDALMTQFEEDTPLKEFIMCRLKSFEGILPWDRLIQEASVDSKTFGKDPEINLRRLAVLPSRSIELSHACSLVVRKLLKRGMSDAVLRFLTKEPVTNNKDQVQFAVDLSLTSTFSKLVEDKGEKRDFAPLMLLYQLTDPELAARLTLSSLEVWSVETCVDLLTLCFYHLPPASSFHSLIGRRLNQLQTYLKIIDVMNDPLSDTEEAAHSPWTHWAGLASDTNNKPGYVLGILLENKAFSLAREWALVHDLDEEINRRITEDCIYDLLEGQENPPDPYTAQGVLEDLPSDTMKMQVCEQVLKRARELESIVLLLQFMLTKLQGQITDSSHARELTNQLLGAKALLMLPRFIRRDYRQFMAQPLLIAEQLLMDLKIDWAGLVIKELMDDDNVGQINMEDTPILEPRPSVLSDDVRNPFTELLMFYAEKSLQYPTMTGSQGSISRGPSPSVPATPRGADRVRSPSEATTIPPTPRHRRSRSGASIFGSIPESAKYSVFEPPPRPPPKEAWETDPRIKNCRICKTVIFGMFNRRQYCRRCGRAVCGACSAHTMSVEGYERYQRVCNDCYNHHMLLSASSDDLQEEKADNNVIYPNLVAAGFIPNQWRLIAGDAHYNTNTRWEFYYEQAPSTPLCLRIIDLMKDTQIGAGFILHCCHSVSLQLVPDPQGRVNEEVDHYFTISIISNLLLNAKLRYARAGDSAGVELCDTYLSRVDLLRLMVSARYPEISSIQELTKPDLARRVRDRLIVDDRYDLAMEVATKCQLDTTAVWSAWGMASLKCGDYIAARERLHHCFQISSQSFAHTSSHLLERIVEQIVASPLASIKQSDDWSEVCSNTLSLTKHHHEGTSLDRHRFSECRYYLTTYGSASMLVGFLSRHNCWSEACVYVLEQRCPTDVFVDNIWMPAIKSGHLTNLEESLRSHDPTLAVWEPYLTAVCRLLSQKSLLNVLYHTQLFMKDYVRAAMTCIKFFIGFKGRSTTTQELSSRLSYLSTAHQHFELAIDYRPQHGDSSRRGGSARRGREDTSRSTSKSMSVHEIHTHINTIKLQQRVTGLLYEASRAANTADRPESLSLAATPGDSGRGGQQQQPATLFGTGQIRGEVICQLLTMYQDLSESFQLANEIVVAYRLPSTRVFTDVATRLAHKDRYTDVRLLAQCIAKSNLASSSINDEVCLAAIKVLASQSSKKEAKQPDRNLEKLIQMINSDQNRIKALIQCGKLKNAYLVAIRAKLHSEVENIGSLAAKAGQSAVRDICEKWLLQNKPGSRR